MKKRNLKILALLIASLMIFSVFTGCVQTKTDNQEEESSSDETESGIVSDTTEKPVKLTYFTIFPPGHAAVHQTLNDSPSLQAIQKATNIELEIIGVPTASYGERKNLLFASAELPDMLFSNTVPKDTLRYGVNDNLIVPIDDLIEKHAPNFNEWIHAYPDIKTQSLAVDGKQYNMPYVDTTAAFLIQVGYYIREAWLDKLSIEPPNTLDEMYEVLTKFKNADLAGGGKTIPLAGANPNHIVNPILQAHGVTNDVFQIDGEIKYGPLEPGFKQALVYLNRLYKDGLIAPDYLTSNKKMYNSNIVENIGMAFTFTGGGIRRPLMAAGKELTEVLNEWRPIAGMKGPDGKHHWFQTQMGKLVKNIGIFVTSANKHPVETMHYLDYTYSKEGAYVMTAGEKGLCWDFDADGLFYVKDYCLNNPEGLEPSEVLLQSGGMVWAYTVGIAGLGRVNPTNDWPYTQDDVNYSKTIYGPDEDSLYSRNLKNWWDITWERQLPPTMKYTQEEKEEINLILQDINVLVSEHLHKIIIGQEPLSKWDEIVNQIKKMKVDKFISLNQAALDRALGK